LKITTARSYRLRQPSINRWLARLTIGALLLRRPDHLAASVVTAAATVGLALFAYCQIRAGQAQAGEAKAQSDACQIARLSAYTVKLGGGCGVSRVEGIE
jgi:hypothetical protein